MAKVFNNPFKGNKAKVFEICYYAILQSEKELIDKSIRTNINIEETADVPQPISIIEIYNCSIGSSLIINENICTDLNNF